MHVVSITMLGKYRVDATINSQNIITRIKTTVSEPALGIPKLAVSDYKGVSYARKFPDNQRTVFKGHLFVGDVARPVRVPVADRAGQPRRRERLLRRHDQPGRHRVRYR